MVLSLNLLFKMIFALMFCIHCIVFIDFFGRPASMELQ